MKLKLSILTAFFIGTLLFPQYIHANQTDETASEEQVPFEGSGDSLEETEAITETPDEYVEVEAGINETQEQAAITLEANNIQGDELPAVSVDIDSIQEISAAGEENFEQDSFNLNEESLTIESQELTPEEAVIGVDAATAINDEEIDIDDLLASLEEFEATNPIQDLSFSDKVKLAIEFLKIKTDDNKYLIAGVSAGTVLCLVCIYFAYKHHKNKTSNPVV